MGKKKALVSCKAGDLTVIQHIQRRLNTNRVNKMAREWDVSIVGTLEAAEIEWKGKVIWHVTDGQHRWAAAMKADPDFEFTVVIEYDLDEKDIARRFLATNQMSAKVPALDQYEVGLVAEDPIALAVQGALNANGLKVGTQPREDMVAAVSALMSVAKKGRSSRSGTGQRLLTRDLRLIKTSWPDAGGERFGGDIIKAVGNLLARWPQLDEDRLTTKLGERHPHTWGIDANALSNAASGGGGEGRAALLMGMFRTGYNYRLSKANKLT